MILLASGMEKPVQTLSILLLNRFLWYIAHTRVTFSFHNCSSIMFTAHPERSDMQWTDFLAIAGQSVNYK